MSAITWRVEERARVSFWRRLWRRVTGQLPHTLTAAIEADGMVIARETFATGAEAQAWLKAELIRMHALSPPPAAATPHGPEISSWLADALKK